MIVELDSRYAYLWNGPDHDIHLGDHVMVPATYVDKAQGHHAPKPARVTQLNHATDYDGELTAILGHALSDEDRGNLAKE